MTAAVDLKTHTINIHSDRCLRRRLSSYDCRLCIDSCHGGALQLEDNQIILNHEQCTGCGRCTALCPNEAFYFADTDLFSELTELTRLDRVVVTCMRNDAIYANEWRLPCLATLSREHLLYLACAGPSSLHLDTLHCAACINSEACATALEPLYRLKNDGGNDLATLFQGCSILRDPEQAIALQPKDRRTFLRRLGRGLFSAVQKQLVPSSAGSRQTPSTRRRVPGKTQLVQQMLAASDLPMKEMLTPLCSHHITILPSCTLCPRCTGMCPTGALKLHRTATGKELIFDAARCTGCALCVSFCKENALEITCASFLHVAT